MKISFKELLLVFSFSTLTACSTTQSQEDSYTLAATGHGSSVFPLAVPLQVTYQDEVKLLRINQMIAEKSEVDDKERALMLYQRGLIYDRIGMGAHSRYDFMQAISLDPTLAEAYNSLGVYLTLGGAYNEAFDAFDAAIELSDDMQYSYLHRAVTSSIVGRDEVAQEDIKHFYELDTNDPYRILWRYIIDANADPVMALDELKKAKVDSVDDRFAWNIVDVISGDLSEKVFFDNIANAAEGNEDLAQRLCEAYYYLGHWHMNNNNLTQGIYYLKLSVATNVKEFIEYKYAIIDLATIQSKLLKDAEEAQQEQQAL
ncbi:lipoprotein NlpI [Psychromonas aquatilis]|uniref:Lipoprotein NlpI n=2 Tax=Bacteria TaxID=2 RepID=A0ABU9GS11_9GAMM